MHGYGWFFFSFWWLIFPLMGFVFGGFGMWMSHRRSQQALDILKTYAEQGKEPPPEVMQAIHGGGVNGPGYGGPGYGPWPLRRGLRRSLGRRLGRARLSLGALLGLATGYHLRQSGGRASVQRPGMAAARPPGRSRSWPSSWAV